MNKYLKYLLLLTAFCVTACQRDSDKKNSFLVEVVGTSDCGDLFLVKFREEDKEKINRLFEVNNADFLVFYAGNLKEEHKKAGMILRVRLQNYEPEAIPLCTAAKLSYGHVWIKSAETIRMTFPWVVF